MRAYAVRARRSRRAGADVLKRAPGCESGCQPAKAGIGVQEQAPGRKSGRRCARTAIDVQEQLLAIVYKSRNWRIQGQAPVYESG